MTEAVQDRRTWQRKLARVLVWWGIPILTWSLLGVFVLKIPLVAVPIGVGAYWVVSRIVRASIV